MEIIAYQKEYYNGVHQLLKEEGWISFIDTYKSEYQQALTQSLTYVAKENDEVIGYIRAITDGVYLTFIGELIVTKGHRRKQVGSKLIQHLEKHHPTPKTELISDEDLFYQKNTFSVVGTGQRKQS